MTKKDAEKQLAAVQQRLDVAEQTLNAIYNQEVDALVVGGPEGDQVFSLQGAEASYRLLVEAMNEGALTVQPDGTILYCNNRFAAMAGKPIEKIIGSSWWRFFAGEAKPALSALLKDVNDHGKKGEFTMTAARGTPLPVQLSVRPLKLGGVKALSVLVTDICELEKAHQALHHANEQLESRVHERTRELAKANEALRLEIAERLQTERALAETQEKLSLHAANLEKTVRERTADLREKIAELEIFSYSISHDLRAPLRAIKSFSQILIEECGPKLEADHAGYLQRIVAGAQHLDTLIQEVLIYSRTSRAKLSFGHVDLDAMVRETIQNYSMFQPPAAQITIEDPIPQVVAHEALLMQCVSNLLGNAVKFIPPNTVPAVKIRSEALDLFVRVWFEDNGIGIHPADQERIFRLFERVHPSAEYPGTGIGLSIVKKGIERMGGCVGVESTPGQGSRFWIQLPAASANEI